MVGRLLSFWEGPFSGAMLVLGSVAPKKKAPTKPMFFWFLVQPIWLKSHPPFLPKPNKNTPASPLKMKQNNQPGLSPLGCHDWEHRSSLNCLKIKFSPAFAENVKNPLQKINPSWLHPPRLTFWPWKWWALEDEFPFPEKYSQVPW